MKLKRFSVWCMTQQGQECFVLQAEKLVWENSGPRFYVGDELVGGVNGHSVLFIQCASTFVDDVESKGEAE